MEGTKAFILPGIAALVLVAYYVWSASAQPQAPSDSTTADCDARRTKAQSAAAARDWGAVLETTSDPSCWSGSEHEVERQRLRVDALAESGDAAGCIEQGRGSSNEQIQARVKSCTAMLEDTKGPDPMTPP